MQEVKYLVTAPIEMPVKSNHIHQSTENDLKSTVVKIVQEEFLTTY